MQFRLLGSLQVLDDDGRPVALGGLRQRQVLSVLLLSPRREVGTAILEDELWPEGPPAGASNSVQVAVSKLRKALGAHLIRTRPGGYVLDVEDDEIDALRFERMLAEGRSALRLGEVEAAARLLKSAVSEWRGEFLSDIPQTSRLVGAAGRLQDARLGAIEALMDAEIQCGRHLQVTGELSELVRDHPFREELHALHMLALYRSGRQADALTAYARARALLVNELGIDPSDRLVRLEQQILSQDETLIAPVAAPKPSTTQLPIRSSEIVGREPALSDLQRLLASGARLITLTGPGGVGKTTLAIALAESLASAEPNRRLVFIDLSPLSDPQLVLATIADSLGVEEKGGGPLLEGIIATLQLKDTTLVVDNFDRVLEAVDILAQVLGRVRDVKLLITSRERLVLAGEQEYVVGPLGPPAAGAQDVAEVGASAAVRLFVARARAARRDFELTPENAELIGALCRRLDGLPLALELAAARVKVLSPSALIERLNSNQRAILSGGARDLPARQRTLDDTIAWSYDVLSGPEQQLLRACSVFAGGFTLESLERVFCHIEDGDILGLVSSLMDKSLLVATTRSPPSSSRMSILQTVREFAARRLRDHGEEVAVSLRHARFVEAVTDQARVGLWTEDHSEWMTVLSEEVDNIRAALTWSIDSGNLSIAQNIALNVHRYWVFRDALSEGLRWILAVATPADDPHRQAQLQVARSRFQYNSGVSTLNIAELTSSVRTLQSAGEDLVGIALGHVLLGDMLYQQGQYDQSMRHGQRATDFARGTGLTALLGDALMQLGLTVAEVEDFPRGFRMIYEAEALVPKGALGWSLRNANNAANVDICVGRYPQALARLESALHMAEGQLTGEFRDLSLGALRTNLGWARLGCGQPTQAFTDFVSALELFHKTVDSYSIADGLAGLCCAAIQVGRPDWAAQSLGLLDGIVSNWSLQMSPNAVQRLAEVTPELDTDELREMRATSRGRGLSGLLSDLQGSSPRRPHE